MDNQVPCEGHLDWHSTLQKFLVHKCKRYYSFESFVTFSSLEHQQRQTDEHLSNIFCAKGSHCACQVWWFLVQVMFYQTKECIVIIILRKLLDLVTLFIHVFINIVIHHQQFVPTWIFKCGPCLCIWLIL